MESALELSAPQITTILVLTSLTLLLVWHKRGKIQKTLRLPPKVPGIPFLGNVTGVDTKRPHVTFTEWSKVYGAVFRISILGEDTVVLNSLEAIREALITRDVELAGRPYIFRIHYGFHYAKDIIFGDWNQRWQKLKRFAGKSLKQFGPSCDHTESIVQEEMRDLVSVLQQQDGQALDPAVHLLTSVVNALSASIIGRKYEHNSPQMERYKLTTRLFSEACSALEGIELDLFPWLRFFPNKTFKKLTKAQQMLDQLIDHELQMCDENYQSNSPRCVMDLFFNAYNNGKTDSDVLISKEDIRSILIDLIVSGTFTTSVALSAFILILINNKQVHRKIQNDTRKHLGDRRFPTVSDRDSLPYMEAIIYEILRYISHVPLCLPHKTTQDTTVDGYDILEGTQVLMNLWALHHDSDIWGDPWTFRPERWFDENNQLLPPESSLRQCLLPFSAGRRKCLGDSLAKERLFLFCVCLVRNFDISHVENQPIPSCDPRDFHLGLILEPKPFKVTMKYVEDV